MAIIFLFALAHALRMRADHKAQASVAQATKKKLPTSTQRLRAICRSVVYRRLAGRTADKWQLPSFGMTTFLLLVMLFLCLLTFFERPYYRPHEGYGSPPIAIRTGVMAVACMPILIALAGKASIVTMLTGISHERLNIVHRWVGWSSVVLSLIHTIPFIVAPLQDVGYTSLRKEFYGYGMVGATMYSGVPPLAMLIAILAFSLSYIRHRLYEAFYYSHIVLAIVFLGLIFWHAGNELDSWAYLWASLALWLASWIGRSFYKTRSLNIKSQWFIGSPAILERLSGGMVRIEVLQPEGFYHSPAQHCFIRFPSIFPIDNHPFTISSWSGSSNQTPSSDQPHNEIEKMSTPGSLVFLVRTHSGFTQKLDDYCANHPDAEASAWIDGPYGCFKRPVEYLFETVILAAGGTGITACLPWLCYMIERSQRFETAPQITRRVILIWAFKNEEHFCWVETSLRKALAAKNSYLSVDLLFYVTNGTEAAAVDKQELELGDIKGRPDEQSTCKLVSEIGDFKRGRPSMHEIVPGLLGNGRNLVFGCGPESLRIDLANTCARQQSRVVNGEMQEVAMHLEVFG